MENIKLLVIDDNENICEMIKEYGEYKYNYKIQCSYSFENALEKLKLEKYDIITLDIDLKTHNGLEEMEHVQEEHEGPIILVTAFDNIEAKIKSFEKGADDYVVKPINLEEIFLRINRCLFRELSKTKIEIGNYVIQKQPFILEKKDGRINLTSIQEKILYLLLSNPNVIFTREAIYKEVWKNTYMLDTRSIDVHISKIRKETLDLNIITVRGKGYMYESLTQ